MLLDCITDVRGVVAEVAPADHDRIAARDHIDIETYLVEQVGELVESSWMVENSLNNFKLF